MLNFAELEWLNVAMREIDQMIGSLSDFRQYPGLVNREDPHLHGYLEHVVHTVRDARLLNSKVAEKIGEAMAEEAEASRRRAIEAAEASNLGGKPRPDPVLVRPPVNIERITMANPTGMREVVLVIDADPQILAAVETMLVDEDYRVLSIRDAFEAISIYTRLWAAIDLIILDFDMPGLNGDLVFEELLAVNPQARAVVSGGLSHSANLKAMLGRGLGGFLPKPYDRDRLLWQIQQILAHRPPVVSGTRD